ncbi:MAG: hypothetical protein M1833_004428 [Piccolia ochrophora]|nr:MAG: hypothetical protein M1833_004428 [Piccolia ochrophora]
MFSHMASPSHTPPGPCSEHGPFGRGPYLSLPNSPTSINARLPQQHGLQTPQMQQQPSYQVPQQYAHPLQRTRSYPSNQGSHPTNSSYTAHPHWSPEHMLRRKTPNGTLAAAYDGTPVDWSLKAPAMKHILLPVANGSSQHFPQSDHAQGYSRLHSQEQSGLPATARFFGPAGEGERSQNNAINQTVGRQDVAPGWLFPSRYQPGIDSVLNQVPVQQASTFFLSASTQVPTVLQPMYQPCLGPTASNGEGPFGPYWPDGAFIPYRPAALRDPRYKHLHQGGPEWTGHLGGGKDSVQSYDWQRPPGMPLPVGLRQDPSALDATSTAFPSPMDYQTHTPFHGHASSFSPNGPGLLPNNGYSQRAQRNPHPRGRDMGQTPVPYSWIQCPRRLNEQGPHGDLDDDRHSAVVLAHGQAPRGESDGQSGNAQFKDKVLCWAHTVYVDLIASIHKSRKSSPQHRNSSGQQQPHRAGIFPKPPRRLGSTFTPQASNNTPTWNESLQQQQGENGDQNSPVQYRSHQLPEPAVRQGLHAESGRTFLSRTHGSTADSRRRHMAQVSITSTSADSLTQPPFSRSPTVSSTKYQSLRPDTYASMSPVHPHQPESASSSPPPATSAMAALEMLTKLCVESAWQWIDGMLLAGCLAYGLGEYSKALRWYAKILDIDANHVEAISNLAATLLSLNRREEAEHYWLRSVKLRPCYFEAVEHLIGLLCGDQRGREAVNIIEFVERSLLIAKHGDSFKNREHNSETESEASRSSSVVTCESSDRGNFDYEGDDGVGTFSKDTQHQASSAQPGFGSSGYAIPGSENGRILALVHAKGNMLYALGDNGGAARAFEDAVLIGAGQRTQGLHGLIKRILTVVSTDSALGVVNAARMMESHEPVLLPPDRALQSARLVFPSQGELPGLKDVPYGMAKKAAISTTSNSLLSLAKIYQDGMSSGAAGLPKAASGVRDILALYYLSLSLQPSPSTANNVGILLASVQQSIPAKACSTSTSQLPTIPGVVPGSGVALALAYYNYGLNLDARHAHLYTNLGSLLKDIGQLTAAIKMYEQAVSCDGNFDIALANLANAVKDQGRISDAIGYYKRAVLASPDFAEAVCGLANALNSVCAWAGRGGVTSDAAGERWHVDGKGMLLDAKASGSASTGWISRVVEIVKKQLTEGESWGRGVLHGDVAPAFLNQLELADSRGKWTKERRAGLEALLRSWAGQSWEGARVVRLLERAVKRLGWQWYHDKYILGHEHPPSKYIRPHLPSTLSVPSAPTVLPFHTFTCPLSARQIRMISQRNGLRISCSTLRSPWLPSTVYCPPTPPAPHLNVGYVSSDFNNHPLAHLMQSVFGLHDSARVKAFCYATTASDNSAHRHQIEREAPTFHDASGWSPERIVRQIVQDGIHVLINLNGYTRGARNEVFAARPAPIQMSFMGFAGTLGAEWCDYLLADEIAVPLDTLRPWRRNVDLEDHIRDGTIGGDHEDWVYSENVIFCRSTFFCCDHRQSAPGAKDTRLSWDEEQAKRWEMRKEMFPHVSDDAIIMGNFNQLYKIEPSTFRTWLRILSRVPNAVLWLLRFPDLGENNLKQTAQLWAGREVASRIIFTDVAPKHQHISRARVCDLFLDTPECNAHTTAADVLWSGTPLLTFPKYKYKMCSRMAASILRGALPKSTKGNEAAAELIASSEEEYEEHAVRLGKDLQYEHDPDRRGTARGRLSELRRLLFESRWSSALFDTKRWVGDLEDAYELAWRNWVKGEGGDIWL